MSNLTLLKLGGSLITDKQIEFSYRADMAQRIASEIRAGLDAFPDMWLLIGHGSGSFGHFAARRHGTNDGVLTPEEWRGFAEVATVAADLSNRVTLTLHEAGIPVWRIQPSASAMAIDGRLETLNVGTIHNALNKGLVPLVHGDVALDATIGGTIISTEMIFAYLVAHLPVDRILLVGEVPGVYDENQHVIPEITPQNFDSIKHALGGSRGTDVTGGMLNKVQEMLALIEVKPHLRIYIIDGTKAGLLRETLSGNWNGNMTGNGKPAGTLIHHGGADS